LAKRENQDRDGPDGRVVEGRRIHRTGNPQAYVQLKAGHSQGDSLGATILLRSLNESAMTFAWLMIDSELGSFVMRLDEIRTRLDHSR
jgi:hypothetical protein